MTQQIIGVLTSISVFLYSSQGLMPNGNVLAEHEMSLSNRYPDPFVNGVFKDNILLNFAYLSDKVESREDINWDEIREPFKYEFKLEPKQTFAYHEDVLTQYKDSLVKTTKAHFNDLEGFKSDGYLMGDGVCHFASLIYWVAKDANLDAYAPSNHDFAIIPEISKEYGVAIYSHPDNKQVGQRQNLYITNNKEKAVTFKFEYDGDKVKVSVAEN